MIAIGICGIAACASLSQRGRSSRCVGAAVSLVAPDLTGREVDVAANRGKVRVVHFWASWCEPCERALPAIDALARELGPRGLAAYAVSIDEDRQALAAFLAKRPLSLPVLLDADAARMSALDVHTMPVSLVVDRQGVIRHVNEGWDDRSAERERRQVEALLAEP
jgi:cytochrome c biogenesis protein CcmG/thiol:disulfide interchange protein DsbE